MATGAMPPALPAEALRAEAAALFGVPEASLSIVFSPYRICPLGAHIDHQGGPVTAMALDFGVTLAFAPSPDPTVELRSHQYKGLATFRLDAPIIRAGPSSAAAPSTASPGDASPCLRRQSGESQEEGRWGDYARGAAWALLQSGHRLQKGILGLIAGRAGVDCSGISSSAAVGVAYLLAFAHANSIALSPSELIELDRLIENGFLGLSNGVLDQSAIVLSRKDHLTVIRCKDRSHDIVPLAAGPCPPGSGAVSSSTSSDEESILASDTPLPAAHAPQTPCKCGRCSSRWPEASAGGQAEGAGGAGLGGDPPFCVLLAFSGIKKALTSTAGYNSRVQECRDAAAMLIRQVHGEQADVASATLGDVTAEEFENNKSCLPEALLRRARHFFTESARVQQGVEHWRQGDLEEFGRRMSESGASSIHNYECGTEALIDLREVLLAAPGVLGARFSGAGFRGCCVALAWRCMAQDAAAHVAREYSRAHPDLVGNISGSSIAIVCGTGDGARVLE